MAEIDCLNRVNSILLWSAVLRTVGTGYFFRCFLSFEMQNDSSQPKNGKSTSCKTRPTLVKKMAMLDEDLHRDESLSFFVLAAVSWSINQSINRSVIDWTMLQILLTAFIRPKTCFSFYVLLKWLFQNLCAESKRTEIIDWHVALCSDSGQLCLRMRNLDSNQVTGPTTYGSVHCTAKRLRKVNLKCEIDPGLTRIYQAQKPIWNNIISRYRQH